MADNGSVQIWVACITAAASITASVIAASKLDLFRLSGDAPPAATAAPAAPPPVAGITPPGAQPPPAPAIPVAEGPISVDGSWLSPDGVIASVIQGGNIFDIQTRYSVPGQGSVSYVGRGSVTGRLLDWGFRMQNTQGRIVNGRCQATVARDDTHIQGTCQYSDGPMTGSQFALSLTRKV